MLNQLDTGPAQPLLGFGPKPAVPEPIQEQPKPAPPKVNLTPDEFKRRIVEKAPDGVASDGIRYADMDPVDLTKRLVAKYPTGRTSDGYAYTDFLPKETAVPDKKTSLLGKVGGFAGDLYNTIASPFIGLAATPVQAGVALYNKATGSNVQDPYRQGIPSIAGQGKNTEVTKLGLEEKAGDALQVGSYFVPGTGVGSAAAMGALQGAGSQMSKGADLAQVATGAGMGAAVGAGTSLAVKGVGYGLQKAGDAISGAGHTKAIQGIKDAYGKALNLSASQRGYEARTGKDLADVLMKHGATLGRYGDGTLDTSTAITTLQPTLDSLDDKAAAILAKPEVTAQQIDLGHILASVNERIQKQTMAAADKIAMQKEAARYIEAEIAQNGSIVNPAIADTIKSGFWKAVGKGFDRDTVLRDNTTYLLGNETKKAIEQAVKTATGGADDIAAINAGRGDLIDAIRRLTKLDGVAKVRGGALGNMFGSLTGTIAGSTLGFPGALAGDYFGGKAAQYLNDPAVRIAIAQGKAGAQGLLPGLLGKYAEPVGTAVTQSGSAVSKASRAAALLGNLLTK